MESKLRLDTDVLVLGSGPAGFGAAYTAAKNGAKVILVEQCGDVGGISTTGLMSHWVGRCDSELFRKILSMSAERNEGEFKGKITETRGYTIPYRCLLPEVKENLLLSGRNISGTHIAHSNFRAMPICLGIGEAAGVAAAIAVKTGKKLCEIDAKDIRKELGI